MSDTLKDRILAFVRANPKQSATTIAKALEANLASVSSTLCIYAQTGILRREAKGPRGGYLYSEASPKQPPRTRFERILGG